VEGRLSKSCSSCVYLHPTADQDLSIEEPHSTVDDYTMQYRCGASFECLKRAAPSVLVLFLSGTSSERAPATAVVLIKSASLGSHLLPTQ